MAIKDRLIPLGQSGIEMGGVHDMVNPFESGQNGPVPQIGKYITNASHLRRNLVARVLEFPRWVDYMPNPGVWKAAIKSFIEVHTTFSGLDKGLQAEYNSTQQGRNNVQHHDAGIVTENQSSINHTTVDKFGHVYRNLFTAWLKYGVCDPHTGHPGIAAINPNVPDHLPDMYCMTVIYFEPDAYQRKVVNAWWMTNMAPTSNGPDIGDRDPNNGPQTVEMSIDFVSQQDTSWGAVRAAQAELDRMRLSGLRPYERKAWLTPSQQNQGANPDVIAAAGGSDAVIRDLEANRL